MHSECVVIVAYKKEIKREKQEGLAGGIMSARRKQLIALSVVLVCVIGMAAYGVVRVSNKTADKENGFDVAMTPIFDSWKDKNGYKPSKHGLCSRFLFRNDMCYIMIFLI